MVEIGPQFWQSAEGAAGGLGQFRLAGDFGQLGAEPIFKVIKREGHCRVPNRHKEGNHRLGAWVSNHRFKKATSRQSVFSG